MSPKSAREWLDLVLDPGWTLLFEDVVSDDPLQFPGYGEQLRAAREKTGCSESVLVAEGTLEGRRIIAISFEFGFLGGSMGVAAGERIARAFERGAELGASVIAMTASGGARMQEGMLALSQMPATLIAREKLAAAKQPFICYMRNPTTGGVFASFANSADLLWAEPHATIGFAGPRVAETVTGEPLPEDSHTAESALRHGLIDNIAPPNEIRRRISQFLGPESNSRGALHLSVGGTFGVAMSNQPPPAESDAWDEVVLARDPKRPTGGDYLPGGTILGRGGRDTSVLVSIADDWSAHRRPVFIAQNRFAGTGRTEPGGYARARRAIDFATRFNRPIVTLIDTPGADPAAESEGIAREISETFVALLDAPVPTVAVCVGEGGSGGALAFAACDFFIIQEHAIFSVIAPEGAASILRRSDVEDVARELRLTARDLERLGLADLVVEEPKGGAQTDPAQAIMRVQDAIKSYLKENQGPAARRQERWRVYR
jgi:acetyl-CoA carboxylase carboxyl transferase subunit beta